MLYTNNFFFSSFFLLLNFFKLTIFASSQELSLYIESDGKYTIYHSLNSSCDIEAYFVDELNVTGWHTLVVKTNVVNHTYPVNDKQRMFGAGLAEGYLTSLQIYQTYQNMLNTSFWDFTNGPSESLIEFLNEQKSYQTSQIQANLKDPFWIYSDLLNEQLNGLAFGYNLSAKINNVPTFNTLWPFEFLNLAGDLLDLMQALNVSLRIDYHDYSSEEYLELSLRRGRCSACIKITPEIDDVFIGHSSWFTYQDMLRIFKRYIFKLDLPTATEHMLFSSYPGYLESLDDFYIMSSGLIMLQTTNGIPNITLYDKVTPNSLYAWQRVRIANALSTSGPEWYANLARENSGTYNNQYMVLNLNLFEVGHPLSNNLLWVVEQIPGLVYGQDMTSVLERGYWASYNVPALELIYNLSGYPELVETNGVANSYDLAPRARIFRRDANSVETLEDFQNLMRYNNYLHDKIENNNSMWAICSRGDLSVNGSAPFGCYDSKIANLSMILNLQALVINGPTYEDLPPFNWNLFPGYLHLGMPDLFKFDWQWMGSWLL